MILVADQNRSTAELLVRRLRSDGFTADAASTAHAMVMLAEAGGISVLLLDPSLSGALEALALLRSRPACATLPVIVFSTSDRAADVAAARAAGATSFLVKGRITPKRLVDEIRALLGVPVPVPVHVRSFEAFRCPACGTRSAATPTARVQPAVAVAVPVAPVEELPLVRGAIAWGGAA